MVSKQLKQLRRDYVKHVRMNRQNKAYVEADNLLRTEPMLAPFCNGDVLGTEETRFDGITPEEAYENPSKLYDILNR